MPKNVVERPAVEAAVYLISWGTAKAPAPSSTTMAAATKARRTRSLRKYGTLSRGIDGSPDSTTMRPPRALTKRLLAPSDISTARIVAWSPPTRACETERPGARAEDVAPAAGADALTGGR